MIQRWRDTLIAKDFDIFNVTLIVSLLLHLVFLVRFAYFNATALKRRPQNVEVIYQVQNKQEETRAVEPEEDVKSSMSPHRHIEEANDLIKRDPFPTKLVKDVTKMFDRLEYQKKQPSKLISVESKRKISIPVLKSEKISSPRYLNYHQKIRQKIKERAYLYATESNFESGEVYLTFVLLADGTLKEIQIIEDRTSASSFLRGVGLRSIKESSPFPPFPEDLKYPELSFNVVISFKLDE